MVAVSRFELVRAWLVKLLEVAAALKAAGLAFADQYLNELKLMHVESGYDVEAWLARTFQLCKKPAVRERGPVKRAQEVQLESWPDRAWVELTPR